MINKTTVNVGGHEIDVIGVEGWTDTMIISAMMPYLSDINRFCMSFLDEYGDASLPLEIHIWNGKLRVVRVLGEFDWPPKVKS